MGNNEHQQEVGNSSSTLKCERCSYVLEEGAFPSYRLLVFGRSLFCEECVFTSLTLDDSEVYLKSLIWRIEDRLKQCQKGREV